MTDADIFPLKSQGGCRHPVTARVEIDSQSPKQPKLPIWLRHFQSLDLAEPPTTAGCRRLRYKGLSHRCGTASLFQLHSSELSNGQGDPTRKQCRLMTRLMKWNILVKHCCFYAWSFLKHLCPALLETEQRSMLWKCQLQTRTHHICNYLFEIYGKLLDLADFVSLWCLMDICQSKKTKSPVWAVLADSTHSVQPSGHLSRNTSSHVYRAHLFSYCGIVTFICVSENLFYLLSDLFCTQ